MERSVYTLSVMPVIETTQNVPFSITRDGTIRIAETRVSLDSLLHHYKQGATAEEIALRFPALRLADIHSSIAYYLNHEDELDAYLVRQGQDADELQQRLSADPAQQQGIREMRERIKRRIAERQQEAS